MTRTNFDVWRDQLTPEKAARILCDARTAFAEEPCPHCPAREFCEKCHDKVKEQYAPGETPNPRFCCQDGPIFFCVWASTPAEEEKK